MSSSQSSPAQDEPAPRKRERSARYPGVALEDSLELATLVDRRGLDGLTAGDIATAMGYTNIKTNTFSSRLSAARQFGLLALKDDGYTLTTLARSILHPVDPGDLPRLRRQAMLEPPLYKELFERFGGKRMPEPAILANVLYHDYDIIASAKQVAAEAFLESARHVGLLGDDGVLRTPGSEAQAAAQQAIAAAAPAPAPAAPERQAASSVVVDESAPVRIDLRLWGADSGKVIRVRAPEAITEDSLQRLLQAIRLHIRIEEPAPPADDRDEADADPR